MTGEVDAVVVGLGWVGGIISAELTQAGMSVVALERGRSPSRELGDFDNVYDEMDVRRRKYMQDVTQETWTLRHTMNEDALPMRRLGAFTPGSGVGGSSLLYGGHIRRYSPRDFVARTATVERHGPAVIPDGSTLTDWGITYDDLAPYYDRFEAVVGVGGQSHEVAPEPSLRRDFQAPPLTVRYPLEPGVPATGPAAFHRAAGDAGLHPFPIPTSTASRSYTNPYGLSRPACTQCGFCFGHPCQIGAKGEATTTVIPAALATGRLEIRDRSYAFEVMHDGGRAYGVRYHGPDGNVHEQRASLVILSAFAFGNTKLLLLSGMGRGYDPRDGTGSVGKNYSTNLSLGLTALFAGRSFRNYIGAASSGFTIDDFAADTADPTDRGFLGGADISSTQGGRGAISRLAVPPGTPRWGAAWKRAIREWYDHDVSISGSGQVLPYRDCFLDLDPRYRDRYGHALLRITFDWKHNERQMSRFLARRMREIAVAMGADHIAGASEIDEHFDTVRYQGTHNTGGAIMGVDPSASVVDPWLRMWDFENVWVVGGSAIPQGSAPGPTGTIGALAFRAVDNMLGRT